MAYVGQPLCSCGQPATFTAVVFVNALGLKPRKSFSGRSFPVCAECIDAGTPLTLRSLSIALLEASTKFAANRHLMRGARAPRGKKVVW
jgi:hypothetical protein